MENWIKKHYLLFLMMLDFLIIGVAVFLNNISDVFFQEHGLFENLTVVTYIIIGIFYTKKLYNKFGILPLFVIFAILDREIGFLRTVMSNHDLIEYKKYIDITFVLLFLNLTYIFLKKHFSYVISVLKFNKIYLSDFIITIFYVILNIGIATYAEKNYVLYIEESLEYLISILIFFELIIFYNMVKKKELPLIKN